MKADTLTLKQVFSKDIRYVVPMFQRPYVWNKRKHWEPLWEDVRTTTERLMRALDAGDTISAAQAEEKTVPHFLGAIVVDHILGQVVDVEARHVIDGQQRLTTLQLLLDAVQQVVAERGSSRDAKLLSKLVLNDEDVISSPDDRFKVWPTTVDQAAFRATMDDDEDPSEHRGTPIADAHRFFSEEARTWITEGDDAEARGSALSTALHGLFQLVVIDLEPHDNAQVIFETLNARGTPLLAADLVKNHVMQQALTLGLDAEALYHEHWEQFDGPYWRQEVKQGRLNRPRIDLLLDYWLEFQSAVEVPAHDVFPAFRRHLEDAAGDVIGVTQSLRKSGGVYEELHSTRDHTPEGTFLYRWDILEAQVITPLLLWLFGKPEHALPLDERRLALRSLESYLVRRMVARLTTKDYNHLFLEALSQLKGGELANAGSRLTDFLASQTADARYWPNDAAFAEALLTEPVYSKLKRARLRMLLEAIEDDLRSAKTEDEHVTRNRLTIEHLLPQAWTPATWPLPGVHETAAETVHRNTLLHTLGNLTLVTDRLNPELSNGPWKHKRPRIEEHGVLRLHASFKREEEWGEPQIVQRSRHLAERAIAIWSHPYSDPADFDSMTATALDRLTPVAAGSAPSADRTPRLLWMLQEEILEPGELLVDYVPSRNVRYGATLDEDGWITVDTGERFWSPSGASKHFHGTEVNGWERWRVPRLGNRRLLDLEDEFNTPTEDKDVHGDGDLAAVAETRQSNLRPDSSVDRVTDTPPSTASDEDLTAQFHRAMVGVYQRARDEANYNANYFIQMVSEKGGLATAKQLLGAAQPSHGFTALWEAGRLDLSVEAVVLRPEYSNLFSRQELRTARRRLADYGYEP